MHQISCEAAELYKYVFLALSHTQSAAGRDGKNVGIVIVVVVTLKGPAVRVAVSGRKQEVGGVISSGLDLLGLVPTVHPGAEAEGQDIVLRSDPAGDDEAVTFENFESVITMDDSV